MSQLQKNLVNRLDALQFKGMGKYPVPPYNINDGVFLSFYID
jgi:hypothetical protein